QPRVRLLQRRRRVLRDRRDPVRRRALDCGRSHGRGRMTAKIKALVVDDEPIARARMVSLLREETDIELVGECSSGVQAKTAIESTTPDLLFLDIQMPEMNGLELARTIQSTGTPAVVFVTAYDDYAVRAFEVHALDYLLKR